MNLYGLVILLALLAVYLIELAADLLNLRHLESAPSGKMADLFDPGTLEKTKDYTRTKTRFGILSGTFDLALLLALWFLGGFNHLDRLVRSFGFGPVATGLLFAGILLLAKGLLDLPFLLYSTFVIEERFGFNRTTLATFAADLVKGTILAVVFGGPLLALILWFFGNMGPHAWLYCWGGTAIFLLFVQFIAPAWIMPLFNRFTPLPEGPLREAILHYARTVSFPLENLFVMDGSKRSSKSNAFFTGFGRNRRIALFDTLIENHTVPELVAILAHEIGHYKKRHVLQGMFIAMVHTGLMLLFLSFFLTQKGLFDAFYMDEVSLYGGLVLFGILFSPLEAILSVVFNALSRRNEYAADRFAVETTGDAAPLAVALMKLSRHNLSNLAPHPFYVFLHHSHPPLMARIGAMEASKSS